MAYQQLMSGGGTYLKWDVPKVVEGRIVAYEAGEYDNKPTLHVVLEKDDGEQVKCPVSKSISAVNSTRAPVGSRLRLVYKGKEKGKSGKTYNNIEAFLDVPEPNDIPGADPFQQVNAGFEYDENFAKLELLNPAMAKQLPVVFPDLTVRAQKLKDVLAQLGAV